MGRRNQEPSPARLCKSCVGCSKCSIGIVKICKNAIFWNMLESFGSYLHLINSIRQKQKDEKSGKHLYHSCSNIMIKDDKGFAKLQNKNRQEK